MQKPLHYRNKIPFYYDKTKEDFHQDQYECYDPVVIRQSMLHLSDHLWQHYPMQSIADYIETNWPNNKPQNILEIGCGVGRMIGDIASQYPESHCWGIDYSYQMLKRAQEVWIDNVSIEMDSSKYGFFDSTSSQVKSLNNLNFGLAKCEALPFADNSQDLIFSSFLMDRLPDPIQGLREMKRVLREDGKIIIVTPLNFNTKNNWKQFFPASKFRNEISKVGFEILNWSDDMHIIEPLDARGNHINWSCIAMVIR